MPVRRGVTRQQPLTAPDLEVRLVNEFDKPREEGQPLVFEEPPGPADVTRLFVVWDDWSDMSQQDRSAIILGAYEKAKGEQAALKIVVAMGLTTPEADQMGIPSR